MNQVVKICIPVISRLVLYSKSIIFLTVVPIRVSTIYHLFYTYLITHSSSAVSDLAYYHVPYNFTKKLFKISGLVIFFSDNLFTD